MLRGKARKTGAFAFPEQANCNGVIIMSQRKAVKGACTFVQAARD